MSVAVVLFTRDLRVHDHPALHRAIRAAPAVVPLFVQDPAVRAGPNRQRFLAESLADLRASLRQRGGDLILRTGDPVTETVALARSTGAGQILLTADASRYAAGRQDRLAAAARTERLKLTLVADGVAVVPPGAVRPSGGGDVYRIFTPYWRAWQEQPRRGLLPAPRRVTLPAGLDPGSLPEPGPPGSPELPAGGETAGRRRLTGWRRQVAGYAERHDDLPGDRTSRLSVYLHFGCVSAVAAATTAGLTEGGAAFVRQLCWRDFYLQLLWSFPELTWRPFRNAGRDSWRDDPDALAAWRSGHTGVPIVDAGMRQLAAEGFLHNRARLITAGYLCRILGLDWRAGAAWYDRWLVDADVANNYGNWQWVAGTGTDTRPNRGFNPVRQAHRFDPDGAYVRRYVPELAGVEGPAVHEPWRLPALARRALAYPEPLAAPDRR